MGILNLEFNLTEDGDSKVSNIPVSTNYMFYATGDFGGGCLSLETSPDGLNWFTVDQLTSPGRLIRYMKKKKKMRISLSESTSPDINTGVRQ